jgi:hypothetical protein
MAKSIAKPAEFSRPKERFSLPLTPLLVNFIAVAGVDIMVASALSLEVLQQLGFRDGCVDFDVAEANLRCAAGLPGADGLDVNAQLARLDEIAADVRRIIFLKENYDQFLHNPGKFHNSQAYFCVVCMISILKTKYRLFYSPKWKHVTPETEVPDEFGKDARDQFIHAILDGEGGTCGSLPVFIVAVGRRMGMPLKLVKAYRHLFIRWDDPEGLWNSPDGKPNPSQGEVFNIEATGPDVHRLTDAEYRYRWPRAIPDELLKSGIFLKSLAPEEELSEFLAMRAYCLLRNDRLAEGIAALRWSCRLAPHNSLRQKELEHVMANVEFVQQGSYYINRPVETFSRPQPIGPRWVQTHDGSRMLVQVLMPEHMTPMPGPGTNSSFATGISLQQELVQLPNGHRAWAEVPTYSAGQPMEAHWVELSANEFALVHRPFTGTHPFPDMHRMGKPILPEPDQPAWGTPATYRGTHAVQHVERQALLPWQESSIKLAIEQVRQESSRESRHAPGLPAPARYIPAIGFVPTHHQLPRVPGQATSLPHLVT